MRCRSRRPEWLFAILVMFLASCSQRSAEVPANASAQSVSTENATSNGGVSKPDVVDLALNWLPEAEHGGFYAAELHGDFAERNLQVKIIPGGPGVPVVQNVASGKVLFGVTNADQVILGQAQEADIVAVFAPLQHSPRCLMVHKKSGITKFEDLKDVTLAINANQTFLGFLKKRQALPNVRIVQYTGSVAPFLQDEKFGQQAYVFSEPFVAQKQGAEPVNLMVSDLGFNPYTSVLITRRNVIREQPGLVRRVVEACRIGWRTYLDEPAKTNAHIHSLNPEMGLDILEFGTATLKPLCETGLSAPDRLGEMTLERWQALTEQLIEGEALKPGVVEPSKVFDAQFLTSDKRP